MQSNKNGMRFRPTPIPLKAGQKPLRFSFQEIVGHESIRRVDNTPVEVIGCGVIGRRLALSLAQKGYPLALVDHDNIESHNLLAQGYSKQYLGLPKVMAIGHDLYESLPVGNQIIAIPKSFRETVTAKLPIDPKIVTCQTHDFASRMEVAYHFYLQAPVVFSGTSATANMGWVFVQQPGQACLRCAFPAVKISGQAPCGGMSGDIAEVVAGIASYAVDTLAFDHPDRRRTWNLFKIDLTGLAPQMHIRDRIQRNPDCELCGEFKESRPRATAFSVA